ncbi:MAG: redoxin domain-containing protein [Nitrospira sp.]|nr:redoxin domain-containing protein [Nitrospira sp.]
MTECLSIGQVVPNFEMEIFNPVTGDFGKISIDDVKGKREWLILFFYPADFTFVCPTELDDLADKYKELKDLGCQVVSISTDTKYSHMAWRQSEKLLEGVTYPMGADPTGKVSRLFGIYDENTGLALRGTFIINPEGKLIGSEVNFYNNGRNADELLRKMQANVYLANHPDQVCPAKWREGDKTITPSAKIVGKIYEALK